MLRLEPPALAVGSEEPEYLHGGVLATCVDTAAWYSVVYEREGDWVMVDLRCDFLRLAAQGAAPRRGPLPARRPHARPRRRDHRALGPAGASGRGRPGPTGARQSRLMFGRNRFGDLIARQLDIFSEENADLLLEIAEYRERWRRASRERAEEAYGEEQDRVDWAAEALSALCDRYAMSLDEETEAEYRRAFTKAVRRRLPAIADEFEAQTDTGR